MKQFVSQDGKVLEAAFIRLPVGGKNVTFEVYVFSPAKYRMAGEDLIAVRFTNSSIKQIAAIGEKQGKWEREVMEIVNRPGSVEFFVHQDGAAVAQLVEK